MRKRKEEKIGELGIVEEWMLDFMDNHPNFPITISIIALAMSAIAVILRIIVLVLSI